MGGGEGGGLVNILKDSVKISLLNTFQVHRTVNLSQGIYIVHLNIFASLPCEQAVPRSERWC